MAKLTPDDPCNFCIQLRQAYAKLITGTAASAIQYLGNGITRNVEFAKADLASLKQAIQDAEDDCAALTNKPKPNRRFAMTAGFNRPNGRGFY